MSAEKYIEALFYPRTIGIKPWTGGGNNITAMGRAVVAMLNTSMVWTG
jgi:hypothetical protein